MAFIGTIKFNDKFTSTSCEAGNGYSSDAVSDIENISLDGVDQIFGTAEESTKAWQYDTTRPELNKIRLLQDDLDTIFATDNNGQQVKQYYLLEPAFNEDTVGFWGDRQSGLFYNFDLIFEPEIRRQLKNLLIFAKNGKSHKDKTSVIYKYFLSIQNRFPQIAYNHAAEINYELAETLYSEGRTTLGNKLKQYGSNSESKEQTYANNGVSTALSLSHGSCLESEIQFIEDRFTFLETLIQEPSDEALTYETEISGETGGAGGSSITVKGNASYIQKLFPLYRKSKERDFGYTVDQSYDEAAQYFSYNPIVPELTNQFPELLNQAVDKDKNGNEVIYPFEYTVSTDAATQAKLSLQQYFKYIEITGGFDYITRIPAFVSATDFIVKANPDGVGNVANFSLKNNINLVDSLPSIENFVIQNVINTSGDATIDFRGCDRLKKIDMLGCTGFTTCILPYTNTIETLKLPSTVTSLNIEYYPKLQGADSVEFDENYTLQLSQLSIDGRNSIEIIHKFIDQYLLAGADSFEITNMQDGFWVTPEQLNKLLTVTNFKFTGTINIQGNSLISSLSNLDWQTVRQLVRKFGDINNTSSSCQFNYVKTEVFGATVVGSKVIDQAESSDPTGLQINGNMIKIIDSPNTPSGKDLDIRYTSNNSAVVAIDQRTGKITANLDRSGEYADISVIIVKHGAPTIGTATSANSQYWVKAVSKSSKDKDYCRITVGFREPQLGDIAYADGHFDSYYDPTADPIGFVWYKRKITDQSEKPVDNMINPVNDIYDVRIMGREYVGETYMWGPPISISNNWTNQYDQVWAFADSALKMNVYDYYAPGWRYSQQIYDATSIDSGSIGSSQSLVYWKKNPQWSPTTIENQPMHCGFEVTKAHYDQANVTLKAINEDYKLKSELLSGITIPSDISTNANLGAAYMGLNNLGGEAKYFNNINYKAANYGSLLYPLYSAVYLYEPKTSYGTQLHDSYKEHHWYIPCRTEMQWILYCRMLSKFNNSHVSAQDSHMLYVGTLDASTVAADGISTLGSAYSGYEKYQTFRILFYNLNNLEIPKAGETAPIPGNNNALENFTSFVSTYYQAPYTSSRTYYKSCDKYVSGGMGGAQNSSAYNMYAYSSSYYNNTDPAWRTDHVDVESIQNHIVPCCQRYVENLFTKK